MALRMVEVGNILKIFSASNGKHADSAVITAHGGSAFVNGMEGAPNYKLNYYSDHGHILKDPGIMDILNGRSIPRQTIDSKLSQDYELTKYTNTDETVTGSRQHNTQDETYASILQLDETWAARLGRQKGTPLEEIYKGGVKMDVITIRARKLYASPKLSDVLKVLKKNKYDYKVIHCSFCRGGDTGQKPDTRW